jgi:hypothetical protein
MKGKNVVLCAALAVAALLSGCATQVHNRDALTQPNNRFAIVTFGGFTSGLGMTETDDAKMIAGLDDVVYKELNQSRYFKLVPQATVKASKSYALIKGEGTDGMFTAKVAKGYKKFDPKKELEAVQKLMDELRVSAVIQVTAVYGKKEKTAFLSGLLPLPVSGGVANGTVNYTVVAYNRKGEVVWQDTIESTTQESGVVIMGFADVGKIYPQLVDITQEASRLALKHIDEKLGK